MKTKKETIIFLGVLYAGFFIIFGIIYWEIWLLHWDYFIFKEGNIRDNHNVFDFLYFSVVTITTLGYGDILPNSRLVRFFVMIETISGITIMGMLASSIIRDEK